MTCRAVSGCFVNEASRAPDCTLCPPKKTKPKNFSIIFVDEMLSNSEDLLPNPFRTQLQLHLQRSLCNVVTGRNVKMASCGDETETANSNAESLSIRLLLQPPLSAGPLASLSLCLCQGSRWTFWPHFVMDSWFSVFSC